MADKTPGTRRRRSGQPPAPPAAARRAAPENPDALALEHTLTALHLEAETVRRVQRLPRDAGWLLVTAGVLGVAVPGVLGLPFLVLGGLVLNPATSQRAERWLGGQSPRLFQGSARQIKRFLDDLESRYPRTTTPD